MYLVYLFWPTAITITRRLCQEITQCPGHLFLVSQTSPHSDCRILGQELAGADPLPSLPGHERLPSRNTVSG